MFVYKFMFSKPINVLKIWPFFKDSKSELLEVSNPFKKYLLLKDLIWNVINIKKSLNIYVLTVAMHIAQINIWLLIKLVLLML